MTLFNAVDTDGVSICRVTRVAPGKRNIIRSLGTSKRVTNTPITQSKRTCRSRAWGNSCNWRFYTNTAPDSPPSLWRLDYSKFYYLVRERGDSVVNRRAEEGFHNWLMRYFVWEGRPKQLKTCGFTFHCNIDSWGEKKSSKSVVEDLVSLQSGCGVVCDLNTWKIQVKP